jgi:hypothetical protein
VVDDVGDDSARGAVEEALESVVVVRHRVGDFEELRAGRGSAMLHKPRPGEPSESTPATTQADSGVRYIVRPTTRAWTLWAC